jgi:hypothetical protein
MPLFLYRCPRTGHRVQGFCAEDVAEDQHDYETVTCHAAKSTTLIRLLAACRGASSQDFACCARAIVSARAKCSAFAASGCGDTPPSSVSFGDELDYIWKPEGLDQRLV